jgi:hypothetical protein
MKITAIGMCLAIALAFGYTFTSKPQRGKKIIEAWETTNNTFKVGVTVYAEENGGFVPGAYYVFRSAPLSSAGWQEIFTFRHDDPVPIPQQQVHFVNDKIGYVFMGWMYAMTTDGGSNWSVWSAEKDLPNWQCCNYRLIQDVRVAPDGVGTMKLNPIPERSGEVPELRTKDYGRHWSLK